MRQMGGEGVVAKRLASRYEPARRIGAWVKKRINIGQEFVIGGFTLGSKGVDALVVGFYAGRFYMQSHGATTCGSMGTESIRPNRSNFGNYRPYVPPSIFTCTSSLFAHVPDAWDFNLEAVLEERGELRSN